jgi:hypothetical protein
VNEFPRTNVGGISLSRLIVGSNWFLGWSHTSLAKDKFIRSYQTRKSIADILTVFFENGVDAVMGPANQLYCEAIEDAQQRTGVKAVRIFTPHLNVVEAGGETRSPEEVFDECVHFKTDICMPHQCTTDALLDRLHGEIRKIDWITGLIRERNMVPGLSTHMPETVVIADKTNADVETYIQIYNAAGFLMQVEADWVMRIIQNAKKPVMTIKPLAAGRLLPPVGLAFVWNTIRDQDMVTIGTTTPDEAREVIELSLDFLHRRIPDLELQTTRSKMSLR